MAVRCMPRASCTPAGHCKVWDVNRLDPFVDLPHDATPRALAFAPDGASNRGRLRERLGPPVDTPTLASCGPFSASQGEVTALSYDPKGRVLATASEAATISIWTRPRSAPHHAHRPCEGDPHPRVQSGWHRVGFRRIRRRSPRVGRHLGFGDRAMGRRDPSGRWHSRHRAAASFSDRPLALPDPGSAVRVWIGGQTVCSRWRRAGATGCRARSRQWPFARPTDGSRLATGGTRMFRCTTRPGHSGADTVGR